MRACVRGWCVGGVQEVSVGDEEQDPSSAAHQDERRSSRCRRRGVRGEETRVAGARSFDIPHTALPFRVRLLAVPMTAVMVAFLCLKKDRAVNVQ